MHVSVNFTIASFSRFIEETLVLLEFGNPKIYTTGLGHRKNREMAGVDDLVMYMQTAVKYNTFYIHPRKREAPPGWCIYKLLYFTAVCTYTTRSSTPAISIFFLGPNPVVVYIFGLPNFMGIQELTTSFRMFFIWNLEALMVYQI